MARININFFIFVYIYIFLIKIFFLNCLFFSLPMLLKNDSREIFSLENMRKYE